ncbi:PEP-CTERM sorting domain-containing protein [Opitutaceae bacterium TAV4]|nr:PEP-CTERM sorting domain-containing protein [Opitutaceae bacterium TAV4]RRJ99937.1 PEP-CTERM sorting domain-containing protein [Opitutaceae bacterium TAV3]
MTTIHKTLLLATNLALAGLATTVFAATPIEIYSQPFVASNYNPETDLGVERNFNTWASLTGNAGWSVVLGANGTTTTAPTVQNSSVIWSQPNTTGFVFRDTSIDVELASWQNVEISIDTVQSSSSRIGRLQFLIQVDNDKWYISNTVLRPITASGWGSIPAGDSPTVSFEFSTDKAAWSLFTLNTDDPATTEVNEGGIVQTALTENLSASRITGIGWYTYTTSSSGIQRFDNLTITATPIPEPATAALLLGGVLLLGATLLRRTRR